MKQITLDDMLSLEKCFPEVIFNDGKPFAQFERILDEYNEAKYEYKNNDRQNFLYELIDVMHVTYNVLYKMNYTKEEIKDGINYVLNKNEKRGYYK